MVKAIVRILGGLLLFFCTAVVVLFLLHPRIPLGSLSGPLSSLLTRLTGSEQSIEGGYFVVPGAWTTFSVENGSVDLTGDNAFRLKADINAARTTIHLWSLFQRKINLDGVSAHGLILDVFAGETKDTKTPNQERESEKHAEFVPFTLQQTGNIDLADITAAIALPETGPPITFHVTEGTGAFSQVAPGKLTVAAVLHDREFRTDIETGRLADLTVLDTDWPFAIHMRHKTVAADVRGSVARMAEEPRIHAEISLSGEHFDDLLSIVNLHGSRNQPFVLQGTTTLSKNEISANFQGVQLGNEVFSFSASVENYTSLEPRYALIIRDDTLNLDVLKGFIAAEKIKTADTADKVQATQISRDDVIFPSPFPFTNLALDLELDELVMAGNKAEHIRLNANMVDGVVDESPFAATFKNASLSGHFSFTIDNRVPQLSVHYDTSSFDIGSFLEDLQLADDMVMHLENASTDLKTSGRTLGELFDNFAFDITATGGEYEYRDPNTGAVLPVLLEQTKIIGVPGEKITATLDGTVGESPVLIVAELKDRRNEPPGSVKDVPITMHVRIAGVQWDLAGNIPLPFRREGLTLHTTLAGEQLNSLNELLHLQLPDLGPYEVSGTLRTVPQGYLLDGIKVQVGSSTLSGSVAIDTKAVPPEVRVGLEAQRIQLDDFRVLQPQSPKNGDAGQEPEASQPKPKGKLSRLTDQAVLDSYNASIDVEVKEVLSGVDHLGSGTLKIEQQQGQFKVDPLQIRLSDGSVNVDFSVRPSPPERLYTFNMRIEDVDYGLVARWFKPDTDMSGIINLRASLESISPNRENIMTNGSGYLDFAVQPRQIRAGVIDLWAVNIFSSLVPFLTPKGESIINCAAGRFNLEDGILTQDAFIIDTSKIRVKGTVEVDFNKGMIDATLRPIPKRPQFYSLSTPIKIHGTLSDLDAGIAPGGAIGTVIRLATSYIVVPLQWIIQNKLPADGTADCLQCMEERPE